MMEIFSFLSRSKIARRGIHWVLNHMSNLLPVERIKETDALLAFFHPKPSYPFHVVIVPKEMYSTLMDLPKDNAVFLNDLIDTVKGLIKDNKLEETGYRLITNGGRYQDVKYLHFHLIADELPKR